jgi:hypothetical protein
MMYLGLRNDRAALLTGIGIVRELVGRGCCSVRRSSARALPTPSMVAYSHNAMKIRGSMAGPSRAPLYRSHLLVERTQIQRLDERPHGTGQVIRRQQVFEVHRAQLHLSSVGKHQPWLPVHGGLHLRFRIGEGKQGLAHA